MAEIAEMELRVLAEQAAVSLAERFAEVTPTPQEHFLAEREG